MSFGNKIGANIKTGYDLFNLELGSIIVGIGLPIIIRLGTLIRENNKPSVNRNQPRSYYN